MNWIKDTLSYIADLFKFWVIIQPWEAGIRVRFGKKIRVLKGGIYLKFPYIDSVYAQPIRLRVIQNPMQTLTTLDGHTITVMVTVGYHITDILKLYKTLHNPDSTLSNLTLGGVSDYICSKNRADIIQADMEQDLFEQYKSIDYGVIFEYVKVVGFASVRTYRLIQDNSWMPQSIDLDIKR